jgi:hypothetical protein
VGAQTRLAPLTCGFPRARTRGASGSSSTTRSASSNASETKGPRGDVLPLRSPIFVGRRAELDLLTRLLVKRRGGSAVVMGEAGIGKSRLVREFADSARDAGSSCCGGGRFRVPGPLRIERWPRRWSVRAVGVGCPRTRRLRRIGRCWAGWFRSGRGSTSRCRASRWWPSARESCACCGFSGGREGGPNGLLVPPCADPGHGARRDSPVGARRSRPSGQRRGGVGPPGSTRIVVPPGRGPQCRGGGGGECRGDAGVGRPAGVGCRRFEHRGR